MSDRKSSDAEVVIEINSVESSGTGNGDTPRRIVVPIDTIVPGESPRLNGVNVEHVHMLTKVNAELPPILVDRSTMRVIDGMHRLRAAIASGQETIEVEFFEGSERAAFVRAVEANITHGLPLSLADRRAAAERMINSYPDWSDRRVAASAGLSDKTIASIRRSLHSESAPQINARIGLDGRTRPLNGTVGRWIASELIDERPDASLREIAREAGISVATVRDVRERMRRGDDPIPVMPRTTTETRSGGAARHSGGRTPIGDLPAPTNQRQFGTRDPDPELDCGSLLEGLKRDPSLRYSDMGRAFLRWLDLRTIRSKELDGVTARIPPHAALIVAKVARRCAVEWENLATELELRTRDPSEP